MLEGLQDALAFTHVGPCVNTRRSPSTAESFDANSRRLQPVMLTVAGFKIAFGEGER